MSKNNLTPEQIARLRPFAEPMAQAIRAHSLKYPGIQGFDVMRAVWLELTGTNYPFRPGCMECMMNLLTDMGNLYFAQTGESPDAFIHTKQYIYKDGRLEEVREQMPAKPASVPAEATKAPKASKTTPKGKASPKGKKTGKK